LPIAALITCRASNSGPGASTFAKGKFDAICEWEYSGLIEIFSSLEIPEENEWV